MKKIFTLIISFFSILHISAQEFESALFLDSFTKDELSLMIGISVNYGVDLYKINYTTPDLQGNQHTASGLLCIPQSESRIFPLGCYQHGTIINGRDDVPSNLAGGYTLPLIFSSFGYVVCAADFLGLGDSPGIHPYVHSATEASAAIDMLLAVREYDQANDEFTLNEQLFVGGYSQGGHASMAAHQVLEEDYSDVFTVTAAAPMSGPYSISEKMIDFTLGDAEYGTVAYLAWVVLAYQAAYPELLKDYSLENVFKQEYLDDIIAFKNEEITLGELNSSLSITLVASVGLVRPKDMLVAGIEDEIKNDPNSPLSIALADNDNYDWVPRAPTRIFYCQGDEQITFENAILADSVMNANGAADVQAVRKDDFGHLTHGGCVFPSARRQFCFLIPSKTFSRIPMSL